MGVAGSSCCQHPQKHPDVTESLQNPPDDDEQGVLVMEGDVEADRKRGDARKGNKARIGGAVGDDDEGDEDRRLRVGGSSGASGSPALAMAQLVVPGAHFAAQLPEPVVQLLELAENLWTSGSESEESPPAPAVPPGLEPERYVRRVSRNRLLQVPEDHKRANTVPSPMKELGTTLRDRLTTAPTRSATLTPSHLPSPPLPLPRSFSTEPLRSAQASQASQAEQLHLRQQVQQQLQQLQQFQLQQMKEVQQRQMLQYQQYQLLQTQQQQQQHQQPQQPYQQMRAQSLRTDIESGRNSPSKSQPQNDRGKALRRTVSATAPPVEPKVSAGERQERKTMQEIALEVSTPADTEAEFQLEAESEDVEIIVGPTNHAVLPLSFEDLWIDDERHAVTSRSTLLSAATPDTEKGRHK
ncbi:unnamed protein product [Effrenium voratum]|nr:unnamed protein product [Effrenium voratum]